MRRPLIAVLLALATGPARAQAPADLADEAVSANPSLQAMRASERALRSRADVAGAWPDPMLMVEYSNAPVTTLNIGDHPMAGLQLKVQQTLRAPGTSRLARASTDGTADARSYATEEAELELRRAVAKTWWMLARTRLLEQVTRTHLERTEELLQAATARYETGGLGQHAILRLQVLRDKLDDELNDFTRAETELQAALARALAREPGTTFATPDQVDALAPPEDVDASAGSDHPSVKRITAEEQAADARASLARADTIPDLTVWAGYRIRTVQTEIDPGTDLVSVGLGVPLPTGSARRGSGARSAALEEASAARSQREAALDRIGADVATILATWRRAHGKATTYDGTLIPGAQATLETTRGDFSVGRADFASLFEAEVALLNLERARIGAAVETHLQKAELEAVLGAPVPGASP